MQDFVRKKVSTISHLRQCRKHLKIYQTRMLNTNVVKKKIVLSLFISMQKQSPRGVLKNFAKFTGKHLRQSLFFSKVVGGACSLIKKEILAQVFSWEFCKIFEKINFEEHLRTASSVHAKLRKAMRNKVNTITSSTHKECFNVQSNIEAAVRRCFSKKVLLKNSRYS